MLLDTGRRKIVKGDGEPMQPDRHRRTRLLHRHGRHQGEREKFNTALRDCAARGRKCAHRYVLATQRPSYRHRPLLAAGPVRLPVGVPLRHRRQLRRGARQGRGSSWLHRRRRSPTNPAASACSALRASAFPAASRPPTSPTHDIRRIAARAAILRGRS